MNITMKAAAAALIAFAATAAKAQDALWRNLDDDHWYSGPKLAEKDLVGKVVAVYCWNVDREQSVELLPRIEQLWQSFKTKPFVLIGSHTGGKKPDGVAALVSRHKITFPMYEGAANALAPKATDHLCPYIYVVNHHGKVVFTGNSDRDATEAFVTAIGNVGLPPSLAEGVLFRKYKALEKRLRLGNSIKSDVKKLEADVKKLSKMRKLAPAQQEQLNEAQEILSALRSGIGDVKDEIEVCVRANPAEALKYMQMFMKTFPEEAETYKGRIDEVKAAIAEQRKAK